MATLNHCPGLLQAAVCSPLTSLIPTPHQQTVSSLLTAADPSTEGSALSLLSPSYFLAQRKDFFPVPQSVSCYNRVLFTQKALKSFRHPFKYHGMEAKQFKFELQVTGRAGHGTLGFEHKSTASLHGSISACSPKKCKAAGPWRLTEEVPLRMLFLAVLRR